MIGELFVQYPTENLVGYVGNSKMGWTQDSIRRDFGEKKRIRLKILSGAFNSISEDFSVTGKMWVWGDTIKTFKGTFHFNLEKVTKLDFVTYHRIIGEYKLILQDFSTMYGNVRLVLEKRKESLKLNNNVELLGYFDNNNGERKVSNFGYITPLSSGIFRCNTCIKVEPLCINKMLLDLGWKSLLFYMPENYNCLFDPYTDKIEPIFISSFDTLTIKKQVNLETNYWWE